MIGLLQRVTQAVVTVDGATTGEIGRGLLVFVAVHREDSEQAATRLAERILTYRVFPDEKGTRASFTKAASPETGLALFGQLVGLCRNRLDIVETGRFGADMQVSLTNDGPVTFWLES